MRRSYWNSEPRPPVNFGEGGKSLPRILNRAGVTRANKDSAPSGVHAGSSIDCRRVRGRLTLSGFDISASLAARIRRAIHRDAHRSAWLRVEGRCQGRCAERDPHGGQGRRGLQSRHRRPSDGLLYHCPSRGATGSLPHPDRARARDAAPHGPGRFERRDLASSLPERQDGRQLRLQHPPQATGRRPQRA